MHYSDWSIGVCKFHYKELETCINDLDSNTMCKYLITVDILVLLTHDDPKLLDGGGEMPKSQGRGWQFDARLQNLLSTRQTLVRWSTTSCALTLAY